MNASDEASSKPIPKIFVVCDRSDTAPLWGYILRQQGLTVILETSVVRVMERWSAEMPDLVVIDVDLDKQDHLALCRNFRSVSVAPILLFMPVYHEKKILEAYAAGVDDVVVKPISPAIFLAKVLAWSRHSGTVPIDGLAILEAGNYRLDPMRRSLINPDKTELRLTHLEFRLLHLLMTRPSHVFHLEEIIESIWGVFGEGDQVLLKNVVYRLRRKIETDPSHPVLLRTWPGGYSFQG